jgi:tetratricopeptide (TPR) repeat protein
VEVLRPNVKAGDEDVHTAFTMGAALARSGFREQAERVLAAARAEDPGFRMGEIDLELGRMRLAGRDFAGAREALERVVALRPGTVEGRALLARALDGQGDGEAARRMRAEAWREYANLPRFQRRHERPFAWRLRPWRPVLLAVGVLAALALPARLALPWWGPEDSMGDERRRFSRITFHRPAVLEVGGVQTPCEVLDLSLKGANVEVPASFAGRGGDPCALVIHLAPQGAPNHEGRLAASSDFDAAGPFIRMEGTLVHREPGRAGVRCDGIDLDGIAHLRRFVELNLGDDALLHREMGALVGRREP